MIRVWGDDPTQFDEIEKNISPDEFSSVEYLEELVKDAAYQDGAGYKVLLIIETSSGDIEKPVMEFEISGGIPGVITEDLPDNLDDIRLETIEDPQLVPESPDDISPAQPQGNEEAVGLNPAPGQFLSLVSTEVNPVVPPTQVDVTPQNATAIAPDTDVDSGDSTPESTQETSGEQSAETAAAATAGLAFVTSRRLARMKQQTEKEEAKMRFSKSHRLLNRLRRGFDQS